MKEKDRLVFKLSELPAKVEPGAVRTHAQYIADQVLAVELHLDALADGVTAHTSSAEGLGTVGVRVTSAG